MYKNKNYYIAGLYNMGYSFYIVSIALSVTPCLPYIGKHKRKQTSV